MAGLRFLKFNPDTTLIDWLLSLVDARYCARSSINIVGVEASAALKNFYILAVGYAAAQLE